MLYTRKVIDFMFLLYYYCHFPPQKESLSHLIGLLTEISLQMKPLQTGYATHRFLSVSWTDTVIRNALCELNMLSIYVQGNTTRTHCSFIVKFRHLGIGERRTFALWMLGRINSALSLVPGLVSEYSRVRNQMFAWLWMRHERENEDFDRNSSLGMHVIIKYFQPDPIHVRMNN